MTVQAPPADRPPARPPAPALEGPDRLGSWLPSWAMIGAKRLELRRRRGLMVAVVLLTVGLPVLVLGIRLLAHAVAPHTYGPAGSPDVFQGLTEPMAEFGFIIAATLGAAAGSSDLTDGMFRHLVATGRSRVSLYLSRIPAGLSILVPLVAVAFTLLCLVVAYAGAPQPTSVSEGPVAVPLHLDQAQLETWLLDHPDKAAQAYPVGAPGIKIIRQGHAVQIGPASPVSSADVRSFVTHNIHDIYTGYSNDELDVLDPPANEMAKIGAWVLLEATIGFMVGLGLGSLLGQRTVATILMIALEIIVTPILARVQIPYFVNGQRAVVGVAMDQLRPAGLASQNGGPRLFGGHGALGIPAMPTWAMVTVIVGWIVGWSAIGVWRMATRDA